MPRGPHASDAALFSERWHAALRTAVEELSWLLGRGYAEASSLDLVGDRHALRARQRMAVRRCACSDAAARRRMDRRVPPRGVRGRELAIDGFNCIIAVEAALDGGVLLRGRDGALRDLASVHGSYRRVESTERAIDLLVTRIVELSPRSVTWYIDRPVSNSGRLAATLRAAGPPSLPWTVELPFDPDRILRQTSAIVATGDAGILDACEGSIDLVGDLVAREIPGAWIMDLR